MKYLFTWLALLCVQTLCAQHYHQDLLLPHETLVFSFKNEEGEVFSLCKGKDDKYLVFRQGKGHKVTFQYPAKLDENAWNGFSYGYYLRGGGKENDGLDLNSVVFEADGKRYILYDEWHADSDSNFLGLKIRNIKTNETEKKEGNPKTEKGSLIELREHPKVKQDSDYTD
jgi:hypothetical protein